MNLPQVRIALPTITTTRWSPCLCLNPGAFLWQFSPSCPAKVSPPQLLCGDRTQYPGHLHLVWLWNNEISSWILGPHWDDIFSSIILNCMNFPVLDGWETIRFILWKNDQWNLFQWNDISCIHIPFILPFRTILQAETKQTVNGFEIYVQ